MRASIGTLLIAALMLLGLGSAHAAAPTTAQLLARHAPVLVLHPDERFGPVPVETFLADSDLVGGRYDNRRCSAREGPAALHRDDAADAAHGAAPTVHGAAFRAGDGRIALQYWLFDALNLRSPAVPLRTDVWQAHEGDWEAVTVLLDRRGRPETVGASRHCRGARRAWGSTECRADHCRLRRARLTRETTSDPAAARTIRAAGRARRLRSSVRTRSRSSTSRRAVPSSRRRSFASPAARPPG